jgi:hypothetical protein
MGRRDRRMVNSLSSVLFSSPSILRTSYTSQHADRHNPLFPALVLLDMVFIILSMLT